MATEALATLDTDGYVRDPAKIAARLLKYFFKSDYSQSNSYRGHVKSLPYIIAQNPNKIQAIKDGIESALYNLFSAQFDAVAITINHEMLVDASTGLETGRVDIRVSIGFTHLGKEMQVANILQIYDNTFTTREDV